MHKCKLQVGTNSIFAFLTGYNKHLEQVYYDFVVQIHANPCFLCRDISKNNSLSYFGTVKPHHRTRPTLKKAVSNFWLKKNTEESIQ